MGPQTLRRHGPSHPRPSAGVRSNEGPPYDEGNPGVLNVDEEGLPVGREARTSKLGDVQPVAGELVHLPVGRDAHYAVAATAILREPQVAPGRHNDVVRFVHLLWAWSPRRRAGGYLWPGGSGRL